MSASWVYPVNGILGFEPVVTVVDQPPPKLPPAGTLGLSITQEQGQWVVAVTNADRSFLLVIGLADDPQALAEIVLSAARRIEADRLLVEPA